MDGITTGTLAIELNERLTGSLVDRIAMRDRHSLVVHLYSQSEGRLAIMLSANPSRPAFEMTSGAGVPSLSPPPSFVMFMRKHFRRARLGKVSTPPGERILIFHFETIDELGDERKLRLIFECMPRTANLIVVNEQNVILNPLRHIDHSVNRARETLPAHPYIPPPEQQRLTINECLSSQDDDFFKDIKPNTRVAQAAFSSVAGFSPILGEEAAYRAGLDPNHPIAMLGDEERHKLIVALKSICHQVQEGDFEPAIYLSGPITQSTSKWLAAHAIPLTHLPYKKSYDRLSDALTEFNQFVSERDVFQRLQLSLSRRISEHMKRTSRKRELHEADLAKGKTSELDKLKGELILAFIYAIPKGATEVLLDNYHEQGSTILCELDPTRSPADNAARYFHRAKRNERRLEAASKLIDRDTDELAWLESLAIAVERAESHDDLLAIDHEYSVKTERSSRVKSDDDSYDKGKSPGKPASKSRRREKAYMKSGQKSKKQGAKEAPPLPPREFTSSDGFSILSGRNNFQNESLLRKARKDDWWFHVKHVPGSHVLIATEGKDVPDSTLEEAAGIAAWYSGAGRLGGPVEVDFCRVRDVKKPPGSNPGRVIYSQYKTIYAAPLNPKELKR